MLLVRTAAALEVVKAHLTDGTVNGVIESFLAQYISVVLYAEMEDTIAKIVRDHIARCSGQAIGLFIQGNMDGIIRRTPKSDIAKLVRQFGDVFREGFDQRINDRDVSLYSNVIAARHAAGHRQGSNITMTEIELGVAAADAIIAALDGCFATDVPPDGKQ